MDKILKASYGAKEQREQNAKPLDRAAAAKIEADVKARRRSLGPRELPTPQLGSPHGAAFWDPKYHGPAYGGHRAVPSPEKKTIKVEIRPGVYHTVEVNAASPARVASGSGAGPSQAGVAAGAARGRPGSAPMGRPSAVGASPAGGARVPSASPGGPRRPPAKPFQMDTLELAPVLARLEEDMRAALRKHAQMHVKDRTVLLRAFGKVLGKRDIDLGVRDTMSTTQFAAAWASLGVNISPGYVDAVFNKYGQTSRGLMPVMVFVEALLYGATRQIMLENDYVQRGAYQAGKPATHNGKILYPECKKGVWPPSDWDPSLAERSAKLPDVRLELEFIYGYDGFQATSPNIFYTRTGEAVYFAAGVGIVYNKASHTQRFFLGHDDDILSLAIHPDRTTVATGQVGKDPCVIIWDTATCKQIQKINQGYGNRGVQALCFSSSGTKLAAVCTDNSHTLYIWDWKRKQLLLERKTQPGAPPTTYGVVWSPFEVDRLITYGQNYIKFFELQRPVTKELEAQGAPWGAKQDAGVFNIKKTHTVFSACFLPSGMVLTGTAEGAICSWKGCRLVRETPGHATGVPERRPDGSPSYGGVRCLLLQNEAILLSGGSDGYVIKWDVSKGDLGPPLQRIPMLRPDQTGVVAPPSIRGLDCFPGSEVFIAGTAGCDVWEVDETPEVLVQGHASSLWGLAMNPAYPHVFATACDADTVIVWSAATRKPVRIVQLAQNGDKARCAAFSPSGEHLAMGMRSGGLKVMAFHPQLAQIYWGKLFADEVSCIKYSPCGRYLAAGSHDQYLDVYDVKNGYQRLARCVGHSSTITHIDWSLDSSVIQSTDQAYEILYFEPRTGKQVKDNLRDTKWATWTCVLGFDVMGIWHPDSDGTDVNSVDRSPSGRFLASADDLGKVNLFNYPVVVQHAPAYRYPGHSSHVMNVRWAADESCLISVGGRDRCAFQWRVLPITAPPTTFYGHQPLQPLDKQGVVYRMPDGVPQQQARLQGRAAGGWPSQPAAAPAAGGVGPIMAAGGAGQQNKPHLSGGGYGARR